VLHRPVELARLMGQVDFTCFLPTSRSRAFNKVLDCDSLEAIEISNCTRPAGDWTIVATINSSGLQFFSSIFRGRFGALDCCTAMAQGQELNHFVPFVPVGWSEWLQRVEGTSLI
jgi:hypothetical protein